MRFLMLEPMAGEPDGGGYRLWPAGTVVTDGNGPAQKGDVLWTALCRAPGHPLAPIDEAAQRKHGGGPLYSQVTGRPVK